MELEELIEQCQTDLGVLIALPELYSPKYIYSRLSWRKFALTAALSVDGAWWS